MTELDEHGTTWWRWDGTEAEAKDLEPYLRTVTDRPVQPNVIRRSYSGEDRAVVFVRNATPPNDTWTPADPADTDKYPPRLGPFTFT